MVTFSTNDLSITLSRNSFVWAALVSEATMMATRGKVMVKLALEKITSSNDGKSNIYDST